MPSPEHDSKLLQLLEPFMQFIPFRRRRELRRKAAGYAGGKASGRNKRALREELYETDEIAKADIVEIRKQLNPDSIALLLEAGPPDSWQGSVPKVLGERVKELTQIFKAMRFDERRFIRDEYRELYGDKTTLAKFNKAAAQFRKKFNIEEPPPASAIEKQGAPINEKGLTAGETLALTKDQGKFRQADANYLQQASSPKQVCGNCRFFLRKEGSEVGACEVVKDQVNWFGTSDLWIGATEEAAYVYEATEKSYSVEILKADEEQRLVTGIVLEPETFDSQGDKISEEEIFKAMEFFMLHQVLADQHEKNADNSPVQCNITVVESYQAKVDEVINEQPVKKGSWVMTVKVWDDEEWADVKSGKRTGFSIRGPGYRQAVAA